MRHPNRMNGGAPILGTVARKKLLRNEVAIRTLMSKEQDRQQFCDRWVAAGLPKRLSLMLTRAPEVLPPLTPSESAVLCEGF